MGGFRLTIHLDSLETSQTLGSPRVQEPFVPRVTYLCLYLYLNLYLYLYIYIYIIYNYTYFNT